MFNFIKARLKTTEIYAPIKGQCIDIKDVSDPVFSKKMIGDGIAVKPTDNLVVAPCSGKLSMMFATKHAFGITTADGIEVLVHIGIDTVNLNGVGFTSFKHQDDDVRKGDPIISFNERLLINESLDMTIMLVITNPEFDFLKNNINNDVEKGDVLLVRRKEGENAAFEKDKQ